MRLDQDAIGRNTVLRDQQPLHLDGFVERRAIGVHIAAADNDERGEAPGEQIGGPRHADMAEHAGTRLRVVGAMAEHQQRGIAIVAPARAANLRHCRHVLAGQQRAEGSGVGALVQAQQPGAKAQRRVKHQIIGARRGCGHPGMGIQHSRKFRQLHIKYDGIDCRIVRRLARAIHRNQMIEASGGIGPRRCQQFGVGKRRVARKTAGRAQMRAHKHVGHARACRHGAQCCGDGGNIFRCPRPGLCQTRGPRGARRGGGHPLRPRRCQCLQGGIGAQTRRPTRRQPDHRQKRKVQRFQ